MRDEVEEEPDGADARLAHEPIDVGGPIAPESVDPSVDDGGRKRRFYEVFVVVGVIVAVLAVFAWLFLKPKPHAFDHGEKESEYRALVDRLANDPHGCDRETTYRLVELCLDTNDGACASHYADEYLADCRRDDALFAMSAQGHRLLNEPARAVDDLKRLVARNPGDVVYLVALARAEREARKPADAAADYEKAWKLDPSDTSILRSLADAYEDAKLPCEAIRVLAAYVDAHAGEASALSFAARLDALRKKHAECGSSAQ